MIGVRSPAEQRREHRLQSPDEIIGLFVALQERGDLRVLHFDLVAEKIALLAQARVFPFEQCDHARRVGLGRTLSFRNCLGVIVAVGRARARCVGRRRRLCLASDRVRHFFRCRAVSHFVGEAVKLRKLFDCALDRNRVDEIG